MVRTTTTRGPAPRRLEHIDRAGLVPKPRVRGGSFTLKPVKRIQKVKGVRLREGLAPRPSGPFNPNARLAPGNYVFHARSVQANAVPRPGDLRSAAISLSRGRLPQGSLLGSIVNTLGRALSGGRQGVPRHVSPVSPPALQSITPNMVNQSEAGHVLRGELRRRLGTRRIMRMPKQSRAGSSRTL